MAALDHPSIARIYDAAARARRARGSWDRPRACHGTARGACGSGALRSGFIEHSRVARELLSARPMSYNSKNSRAFSCIITSLLALPLASCVDAPYVEESRGAPSDEERTGEVGEALGSGVCDHDQCTEGGPLDDDCNPTAATICAVDPYCCTTAWDWICVDEVQSIADNLVCSASAPRCDHTLCTSGAPLAAGCDSPPLASSCVASICAVDSYCCDVAWDPICESEVASVCGKTCDDHGCDLDHDGNPTAACGGSDADDTCSETLQLTECAVDMIGFVNSILGTLNAIEVPLATRTAADVLSCPADTGVGEGLLNVFSSVGPLPKSCNRAIVDDCNDPARSNYWVSVIDDRRPGIYETGPHYFTVNWGSEVEDYGAYGACSPDPNGFDNAAAGIPKLLEPVNDVDGNGFIGIESQRHDDKRIVSGQNHVYGLRFYVPDGYGGKTYIEKGTIAQISSPFLLPASIPLPGATSADHDAPYKSAYVAVDITPNDPSAPVFTALVENNYDGDPWMQWKQQPSCGGQ